MNRFLPLLITIFLLITAHCTFSQGIWKYYTRADGLAGDSVICITQDKLGNMWFGTWGAGFSRLDTNGVWTNFFTSSDCTVICWDFQFDSLKNIWMLLSQLGNYYLGEYVVKFDGSRLYYYDLDGEPLFSPHPVSLGRDSSGHIWCGMNEDGIAYMFDGQSWQRGFIPGAWAGGHGAISDIETDRYGELYFAHQGGISTLTKWIWQFYWTYDIAFDRLNHLWFGCSGAGWDLGMFDGENWHNYPTLGYGDATRVAVDSSNNIWAGFGRAAAKFDGANFTFFNSENGLAQDRVQEIFVDRKGDIWFAHFGGGVSVLHDTITTRVKQQNLSIDENMSFALSQNYPNPFNSSTIFRYELPSEGQIQLFIYDLMGKEVINLINEPQIAGLHQVVWNGTNNNGKEVSSGIYLALLKFNESK
jgi:ligand-binding sensor domain-containing protein